MSIEEKPDISSTQSRTIKFLVVNLIGVGLYLIAASSGWIEPKLADMPGASGGGAAVWFFFAVPVFLLFFLANLGVLLWLCIHRYKKGLWPISKRGWFVPLIWVLAVLLDFLQHGA